jgi:hypothetical protein
MMAACPSRNCGSILRDVRLEWNAPLHRSGAASEGPKSKTPQSHDLRGFCILAERVGFEPTVRENRTPDFESGTFDHSATSPSTLSGLREPVVAQRRTKVYRTLSRFPRAFLKINVTLLRKLRFFPRRACRGAIPPESSPNRPRSGSSPAPRRACDRPPDPNR